MKKYCSFTGLDSPNNLLLTNQTIKIGQPNSDTYHYEESAYYLVYASVSTHWLEID